MTVMTLLVTYATLFFVFASGKPSPSEKPHWALILGALSLLANGILGLLLHLLNRSKNAENELRQKEVSGLTTQLTKIEGRLDDLDNDCIIVNQAIAKSETSMGSSEQTLVRLQDELKDLVKRVDKLNDKLLGHQTKCADKYVQRNSYIDDLKAHRESMALIRENIKQQADIIEKLRP